jgi:uncharacterized SAM-binding protein YcdF (DUF218 family)
MKPGKGAHIVWTLINMKKRLKIFLKTLFLVLSLFLFAFCLQVHRVYGFGRTSSSGKADVAIVLGAAVRGEQPSPVFRERIDHGIDLFRSGQVKWLFLTGGRPRHIARPESEVAKTYAIAHGVPEDRILVETQSHNTYQNLYYAQEVLRARGLERLLVVSDPYHLRRALLMAHDLGLQAEPSPTPTSRMNNIDFLISEAWLGAKYDLSKLCNADGWEMRMKAHGK